MALESEIKTLSETITNLTEALLQEKQPVSKPEPEPEAEVKTKPKSKRKPKQKEPEPEPEPKEEVWVDLMPDDDDTPVIDEGEKDEDALRDITRDDVRDIVQRLLRADKRTEALKVLREFGVGKVTELKDDQLEKAYDAFNNHL